MLGLLGTVTGIINTFKLITVFGTGDAKTLSAGISEALITTKFGLIVAIPSLFLHAFLSRKARRIIDGMEKPAVAFFNRIPPASASRVRRPGIAPAASSDACATRQSGARWAQPEGGHLGGRDARTDADTGSSSSCSSRPCAIWLSGGWAMIALAVNGLRDVRHRLRSFGSAAMPRRLRPRPESKWRDGSPASRGARAPLGEIIASCMARGRSKEVERLFDELRRRRGRAVLSAT